RAVQMASLRARHGIGLESNRSGGVMKSLFRKLGWLLRRPAKETELVEELQFHLQEEAAGRQAEGLDAEAALRAAQRELGNLTLVREDTRATWTWRFAEQFAQDIRYGMRAMRGNQVFTARALLVLAVGIGPSTARFILI